ncbi:dead deah box helicase domain-containing protein [Cystoisospora suis]|uniref:Dead deah box helicase domain-containing protein n=1 Tax=Cystoisospora suis TaxID=483139 RepID=A0A2C6KFS3_9APIC|nr:dead deah box helicase domain-containing protein [Cystoisospora suis]
MHVNTRRFEPNEWQRAKMDQMNGEQKKRYLDIIERKSKQRLLTQLRRKARSLCPHPLHYPIVSTSDSSHPWLSLSSSAPIGEDNGQDASSSSPSSLANSRHEASKGKGAKGREKKSQTSNKKEEEKKKPLKKADLIRMKNTGIQEKKVQNLDAERLADLEKRLEALCSEYCSLSSKSSLLSSFTHNGVPFCIGASHLHSLLLDVLVGPSRRMSLLFNFPYVTQLLKTRDAQRSFVMKVQKLINEAYAGFNKESLNSK